MGKILTRKARAEGLVETRPTELRLLDSALAVFSEKGFEGASVREIVERTGVTRPVLYYHFESKRDLFCRLVEGHFREFFEAIEAIRTSRLECRERLRALVTMAFARTEQAPEVVTLILQTAFSPLCQELRAFVGELAHERMERVAAIMKDGIASGELARAKPMTLARAFCGIMDMSIMVRSHDTSESLTRRMAEEVADLFMDGAAAGIGRSRRKPPLTREGGRRGPSKRAGSEKR